MFSITAFILAAQAFAGLAQDSVEKHVARLADADLENATLGMPGHLATPRQASTAPGFALSRSTAHGHGPVRRPVAAQASPASEWPSVYNSMIGKLKPISGAEAVKMTKAWLNPAVLVDVRLPRLYEEASPQGSVNVPIFLPIEGFSLKRLVTNSMGVEATDRNPQFAEMARQRIPKGKPIILACNRGGIFKKGMIPDASSDGKSVAGRMDNLGTYTQSLRAAAALYDEGFNNIFFLQDGIDQWSRDGLPMSGAAEELAAVRPHGNAAEYTVQGLLALVSVMLVLALMRCRIRSLPPTAVPGLRESLVHA